MRHVGRVESAERGVIVGTRLGASDVERGGAAGGARAVRVRDRACRGAGRDVSRCEWMGLPGGIRAIRRGTVSDGERESDVRWDVCDFVGECGVVGVRGLGDVVVRERSERG